MVSRKLIFFNLRKIMKSGQIFRMYEPEDGRFVVFSKDKRLEIHENGEKTDFMCTPEEFSEYWEDFFDLKRDYKEIVQVAEGYGCSSGTAGADFLKSACEYGADIRILRQNIWEMMISFIISQQKQIPSIRKCIESLCSRFGERKEEKGDVPLVWYTFPEAEAIAEAGPEGLKGLSLGYRERYIYETAVKYIKDGIPDELLRKMEPGAVKDYLTSFTGIGNKVADCICLFGVGLVDSFPIDVHIKDILYREFLPPKEKEMLERSLKNRTPGADIPRKKILESLSYKEYERLIEENFSAFKGVKGIVQQWIFAYELIRERE